MARLWRRDHCRCRLGARACGPRGTPGIRLSSERCPPVAVGMADGFRVRHQVGSGRMLQRRPLGTGGSPHTRAIRQRFGERTEATGDARRVWSAPCAAVGVLAAGNTWRAIGATVARVSGCRHAEARVPVTGGAGSSEANPEFDHRAPADVMRFAALIPLRPGADPRAAVLGLPAPLPHVQTAERVECGRFLALLLVAPISLLRLRCIAARREHERREEGENAAPRGPTPEDLRQVVEVVGVQILALSRVQQVTTANRERAGREGSASVSRSSLNLQIFQSSLTL